MSNNINNEALTESSIDDLLIEVKNDYDDDDESSDSEEEIQLFSKLIRSAESKSKPSTKCAPLSDAQNDQLIFVAKLHKHLDIPRNRADEIIKDTSDLLKSTVTAVKNGIRNLFANSNTNSISPSDIDQVFEKYYNPFQNLQSEAQRFATFKNSSTFIMPENFILGEKQKIKEKNSVKILKNVPVVAQFIPLRKVFKIFFELPGVFEKTGISRKYF